MRKVGKKDFHGNPRVFTVNTEPSMTVVSDSHLADIGNILRKFGVEGQSMLDETALVYGDVSTFDDLGDALRQARDAEIDFMKLDPRVRLIFENDVAVWLDTAHDEEKRDALVEAGFLKRVESVEEAPTAGGEGDPKGDPNAPPGGPSPKATE